LSGYIFGTKACIDNRTKLLNSNTSSTCPANIANFGLLTAEIYWRVWDTPANFNQFRVLAALLHGTLVVGVSQTAALNRGRHIYSAGRPSRSALAHILVCVWNISGTAERADLRHIHTEDVFGPLLGWVWRSRLKVKDQGHHGHFLPFRRPACGLKTSLASSLYLF